MKIHSIKLDENGLPTKVKVTLTIPEIALIVRHAALTGDVINRFWEDGINGVATS